MLSNFRIYQSLIRPRHLSRTALLRSLTVYIWRMYSRAICSSRTLASRALALKALALSVHISGIKGATSKPIVGYLVFLIISTLVAGYGLRMVGGTGNDSIPEITESAKTGTLKNNPMLHTFHDFGGNSIILVDKHLPTDTEEPKSEKEPEKQSETNSAPTPIHSVTSVSNMINSMNATTPPPPQLAVISPPSLTATPLPWDQSRPPSVKSKTEPEGIRDIVTMRVLIDSLGQLTPFNHGAKGKYAGAEYYELRRGSPGDAETIYRSLQFWTFNPALDEDGYPLEAFLTITHIPRSR